MTVKQVLLPRYFEMAIVFNCRLNDTIPAHRRIRKLLVSHRFRFVIGQGWTGPNNAHTRILYESVVKLVDQINNPATLRRAA